MAFFGAGTNVDYLIQQYIKNNGLMKVMTYRFDNISESGVTSLNIDMSNYGTPVYITLLNSANTWDYNGWGYIGTTITAYGGYEDTRSYQGYTTTYSGTTLSIKMASGSRLYGNLFTGQLFYVPN